MCFCVISLVPYIITLGIMMSDLNEFLKISSDYDVRRQPLIDYLCIPFSLHRHQTSASAPKTSIISLSLSFFITHLSLHLILTDPIRQPIVILLSRKVPESSQTIARFSREGTVNGIGLTHWLVQNRFALIQSH